MKGILELIPIPDTIDKYGEELFQAIKENGWERIEDEDENKH